jgi:hypothetical protein
MIRKILLTVKNHLLKNSVAADCEQDVFLKLKMKQLPVNIVKINRKKLEN